MKCSVSSNPSICVREATAGRTASFVITAMSVSPSESPGSETATISVPSSVNPTGTAW